MLKVGFIGWRGMVGSVLMGRMNAENDFNGFEPLFFSTSQVGLQGPDIGMDIPALQDAFSIDILKGMDIIITCQGGDYTRKVYPELRKSGWKGYWIDAASALRMDNDSIIVLDPVNREIIDKGLSSGIKNYIGGNCTVSLMLIAIAGLFEKGLVEWVSSMTYQAASGAGAKNMIELVKQMAALVEASKSALDNPAASALEYDSLVTAKLRDGSLPVDNFTQPLAASLLPWIDKPMENGQSREEWKGYAETNKILQSDPLIPVDGICVRISSMRCHSQGLTIKLNKDIPVDEIQNIIGQSNDWVKVVPNEKEVSLKELTPAAVTGTLSVPIGRIRKMNLGPQFISAFSVGDQLLWGAAEPVRRMLRIVLDHLS
ncbi:MAG: aspartate-semialdehyde dehydrogenase [Chitinivibrionales bacterium]|nr:aspartate-semialdehyde dehydrogenase [Chitinivibrionales bacterium]